MKVLFWVMSLVPSVVVVYKRSLFTNMFTSIAMIKLHAAASCMSNIYYGNAKYLLFLDCFKYLEITLDDYKL